MGKRMDEFVRVQRIGQAASSSVLDSRYTEAIRTTGITTTVVPGRYTYAAEDFGTQFAGPPICCPLSIIWTKAEPAANDAMPESYPKGYVNAAGGDSYNIDQVVEAKWDDAGSCDCACCEFRIYVAFYVLFKDSSFQDTGKPTTSTDLRGKSDSESGVPQAGSGATTTHRTPASSFVFVSDATFSDDSNPLDHAEHARDNPDDEKYFSDLKKLGATESGSKDDPDTFHAPCFARWTDTVRISLPKGGWTFILLQFLAVIRPTTECGGTSKWKMKEFLTMVKSGSAPESTGLKTEERSSK